MHAPVVPLACGPVANGGSVRGVPGGVWDWVGMGEGIPGTHPAARGEASDSEAGPEAPARGLEWWSEGSDVPAAGRLQETTPAGPGRSSGPPCLLDPQNAASWPIRRDSTTFPVKLVKTAKCRLKVAKRPVIVPIYKRLPEVAS